MMAEALGRWLREEMELPPSAAPSPAALRRLCSGPTAPVWDYVTRHVRNHRNVKKIRGNLRWYRHLHELEAPAGPPSRQGALRAAVERLRKELQDLGDAIADVQETAQRLESSLGAGQSRRWAELRRGAELRLLGAEPSPAELRESHQGALRAVPPRPGPSRAELSAILASGAEPEVLVSIKALCKAREAELQRPRPPRAADAPRKPPEAPDWLEQAEAVLIGHSPEAVLWALEALANQSMRYLLAGPAPSAEAPPTLSSLLQERWGAVGGVWGALPPLLSHLAQLRGHLGTLLERGRGTAAAARPQLLRAALGAFRGSLRRALTQNPQNPPQNPQNSPQNPQNPPQNPQNPPQNPQNSPQNPQNPPQNPGPKPQKHQKIQILDPKPPNLDPKSSIFDPKSSDLDPKSAEFAPKSSNLDPKTSNLDPKSSNLDPKTSNLDPKSTNLDPKPPNLDPKFSIFDPKSSNLDLKFSNLDPKSSNFDPKSSNLDPKSSNLDPKSSNLDPKFPNLDPKFSNLDPKSAEFAPKSSNLDPKSSNLDPKFADFAPKSSNLDPKTSNLDPKSAELSPKSPEFAPKSPELAPKSAELAPKSPEFAPKSPNFAPKFPNLDPKLPEFAPKPPEFAPKPPGFAPKSPEFAPKSAALGRLQRRLRRGRGRVLWLQQRLRFLSAATRGRRAALRPLQEQVVGVARAGPCSAPPPLEGAGHRRQELLGALGEPRPPPVATPPLKGVARQLGVAQQGALLSRAAILRQQLRQGALRARRGAGPAPGAGPEPAPPPLPAEGVAELLPQLRLVSAGCQQRIRDWPRLRELVGQWWAQPAQWALATPSGHAPFSHWLQRWRAAAHALQAPPTTKEAPPTVGQGEEPEEEAPPL